MVIKTTILVGHMESVRKEYGSKEVVFIPEFLCKSKAHNNNGYPQELVGWKCAMRTGKYMKMDGKSCFCVKAFV